MPGQIIPILGHQTPTVDHNRPGQQKFLPMVWPWQELVIHSLAATPAPPEVQMSSADDDKNILS
jgi:hypothetical protein